jgi:mRNA interferase MazF
MAVAMMERASINIHQTNFTAPKTIHRGDIYFADLGDGRGSIQGGVRPVLIIQNDIGNRFSPTVIIAPITAQIQKAKLPTHVVLSAIKYGLERDSVVLFEQIQTINKSELGDKIAHISSRDMKEIIQSAMQISIGLVH